MALLPKGIRREDPSAAPSATEEGALLSPSLQRLMTLLME